MPTVSFTHRIDPDLKSELDRIARYEDRSASYMANLAIRGLVEERRATRELIDTGLEFAKAGGPSVEAADIHDWLLSDEDVPFTKPRAD